MKSFDEWYKEANQTKDDGFTNRDFYEAGAQSQQQKIDELQNRIDDAIRFYNDAKGDLNIGMMRMAQLLKGEQK